MPCLCLSSEFWDVLKTNFHVDDFPSTLFQGGSSSFPVNNEDENSSTDSSISKLPDFIKSCSEFCSLYIRYLAERRRLIPLLLAEGPIPNEPGEFMEDVADKVIEEFTNLGTVQEVVAKFESLQIRSLVLVSAEQRIPTYISPQGLSGLLKTGVCSWKNLSMLEIHGKITYLPDEVGNLAHLKNLSLFCSDLDNLPESLGNLQKLQTLDIRMCEKLREIPVEVLNIRQLRNLLISKSINEGEF